MLNIMVSTAIMLTCLFIFLNHPLSLGVILLIQTIIISLITGMMSKNFWFSYILFLIMVGGMMVLFIYMTSVASNENFKLSPKMTIMYSLAYLILNIIMMSPLLPQAKIDNYELSKIYHPMKLSMSKYMSLPNSMLMFTMIIYLLISLIMVVKITNIKYGPLRQKF